MALQSAGAARYGRRVAATRRRLIKLGIVVIALLVVALMVRAPIARKFSTRKKVPPVAQVQPSIGAQQASDVNLVAGAVGQYAAANGALPTRLSATSSGGLVLCGSSCDSTNYEVGGFSVYQAADIRLVPYASNLKVPDQNTMYLVPGAKCGGDGRIGDRNPVIRSMVILYDTDAGSKVTPRCIVL